MSLGLKKSSRNGSVSNARQPGSGHCVTGCLPTFLRPPLRSIVLRASARGAGGRGSILDCVTPKT